MEVINALLANNLKAGQWLWPSTILISNQLMTIKKKKKKEIHISQEIKENSFKEVELE